ncbi:hypothetical protein jhhlp_007240 [Lomentospora prolificans]|uniref:Glycoside hydrolase 131 catalytic N-terminal domain-containing protein n=1 Tax=Lomentospora prolificans TaxID=41688 RepID=A0A2N3N255_9PEZI|nr:hypothetical protein jhhlp_007240 [Lomentospora prolificans]
MFRSLFFLALAQAAFALPAAEPSCPVVFDGRVPADAEPTDFDANNGGGWMPFNSGYVKGETLKWSEILQFPEVAEASRFDADAGTIPVEVTLSDKSIFMTQNGFRRAGLQFLKDTNEGSPATTGKKTIHFSLRTDPQRTLNLTHEYILVWHETAAYDANQFNFQTGTILGQTGLPAETYKLLDRSNKQLWSTPIKDDTWQNFAITIDYTANTLQMWYSEGDAELAKATDPINNNNAGEGQYQVGMLKKPTGTSDVVNSGYQESGLDEGLIYGGIFIEDSASDCVSK